MARITPKSLVFGTLLALNLGFAPSAFAGNIDLINAALNSSLEERALVTDEYKSNEAAERPDDHFAQRVHNDRMELTINGELNGGGGSDNLKDFDSPGRVYRERHIEAKLDKEVKSIDREYAKTLPPTKRVKDKEEGFQYSEAKLRN